MGGAALRRAAVMLSLLAAGACESTQGQSVVLPPPSPPLPATPPEMAAVPPVEAKQPRSFLVFFDSNKADLSADARRVIGDAADEYRQFAPVRVIVLGHADLAGLPRANQALSERRAKAVLAALIAAGVPAESITAGAFGESQPALVTPDGTPEPQNRRVEIYLR